MYRVEGVETIYVKPVDRLQNVIKEYDFEKDLLLADIDEDTTVVGWKQEVLLYCFRRTLMHRGAMRGYPETSRK